MTAARPTHTPPATRQRILGLITVGASMICLMLAGNQHPSLLKQRAALGMSGLSPLERATPLVAFSTIALGGFRGIIADMLWLRASTLQDEGRYLEMVQLADWITKLEPRLTEVWAYHSWNMAFNIGGMMATEEDKWRWVRNGYELLRDEGIRHNPTDPMMYYEIGWLFQAKIGGRVDPTEQFYRRAWAREMTTVLGSTDGTIRGALADTERAAQLEHTYALKPELMRAVDARYGPLDWRLPETHAVYWAYRGRAVTRDGHHVKCNRMIYQSMMQLCFQGRATDDTPWDVSSATPDLRLIPPTITAFEDALATGATSGTRASYAGFLRKAATMLMATGNEVGARQLFTVAQQRFPTRLKDEDFDAFIRYATPRR